MIVKHNFHLEFLIFVDRDISITNLVARLCPLLVGLLIFLLVDALEILLLSFLFVYLFFLTVEPLLIVNVFYTLAVLVKHGRCVFHHWAVCARVALRLIGSYFLILHLKMLMYN